MRLQAQQQFGERGSLAFIVSEDILEGRRHMLLMNSHTFFHSSKKIDCHPAWVDKVREMSLVCRRQPYEDLSWELNCQTSRAVGCVFEVRCLVYDSWQSRILEPKCQEFRLGTIWTGGSFVYHVQVPKFELCCSPAVMLSPKHLDFRGRFKGTVGKLRTWVIKSVNSSANDECFSSTINATTGVLTNNGIRSRWKFVNHAWHSWIA